MVKIFIKSKSKSKSKSRHIKARILKLRSKSVKLYEGKLNSKKSGRENNRVSRNSKMSSMGYNSKHDRSMLSMKHLKDSKSVLDFKNAKSISALSDLSSLKNTQVGELYELYPIGKEMLNLCVKKMMKKKYIMPNIDEHKNISKKLATSTCKCLFEKNKNLSINELEDMVLSMSPTPGSECIKVLDTNFST
jgi:hypothetical protein